MAEYDDYVLYNSISEDMDKVNKLTFGSEDWKRVEDSIDKRYNTTLAEAKLGAELAEKEARLELERMKAEKDVELRKLEAEVADKKSKRELIGKFAGIGFGGLLVFGKILYDNSESITDKFVLDTASKLANGK